MLKLNKIHTYGIVISSLFLLGCASEPHVQDWDRERITDIPDSDIEVSICFDMSEHSKEQVYALARDECGKRIAEVQTLVQHLKLQNSRMQNQAEGQAFQGPVQRQKNLKAMLRNMTLSYVENDKWDCPLATPNRIAFACNYDENAIDSHENKTVVPASALNPEMPPELPDDLKPQ